jgi:uncharacterized protein
MRTLTFVIFISVVLLVHILVNTYMFVRGWQALSGAPALRPAFTVVFSLLFLSYIIGRILMSTAPGSFSSLMIWIGSFWLACMLYFFLFILLLDIFRLFNSWFHYFPGFITARYESAKLITLFVAIVTVGSVIIGGYINALRPRIKTLEITIPKKAGHINELNLVMASDIHMGTIVGRNRFSHMVEMINGLKPDIVLLAGDVVDEDIEPVIRLNLGEMLRSIRSKYGTYAIPGNHEYIGGAEKAFRYLREHDIKLLRDSSVLIDSAFWIVGREDRDKGRFTGKARKEVAELMENVDRSLPVILLDHQPFSFDKAVEAGVDLELSGHTHNGQLWPFNYSTAAIYEVDWGYLRKGNTQFYVSCGAGTWGPPIRIGNRPEIVQIKISFSGNL